MSFEERSHRVHCHRCSTPIPFSDLWLDKKEWCMHRVRRSLIKYDCTKCRFYQPWYTLTSDQCLDCAALAIKTSVVRASLAKPNLWRSWETHEHCWNNPRFHTGEEFAQKRIAGEKYALQVEDLTGELELHVENLQCSGHWLFHEHDVTRCSTCRKSIHSFRHCCCQSVRHCHTATAAV